MHRLLSFIVATAFAAALALAPTAAHADKWESSVDGQRAYDQVKSILEYKRNRAQQVESLFYGLRDKLYVVSPTRDTQYTNSYLTPNSATHTVTVKTSNDSSAVARLYRALKSVQPRYFKYGENQVSSKFPQGTIKLRIFDEIMPTYERLVRGAYAFDARAVLLDNEQTVPASSDTGLLLSTPGFGSGLDFSGKPQLRTYQQAEALDVGSLFSAQSDGARKAKEDKRRSYLGEPAYRLTGSNKTHSTPCPSRS